MKFAISYLRFSSAIQSQGDSSRRQNAKRDQWLERNPDVVLEKELNDFGLSAFKAHHVSKGDLGDFLAFIETPTFASRMKRDEVFLLVESLDRLSREQIMTALHQLERIVEAGVKVVTLADGQTYDKDSMNDLGGLIVAIVTMSRAHNESAEKSRRIKSVFEKKRQDAKAGKVYSKNCPAWLEIVGGKYKIKKKEAKIVADIIREVAKGRPTMQILRELNAKKIPTLTEMKGRPAPCSGWSQTSVRNLVIDRPIAIGTMRTKDGDIENFYPPIIDAETFAKAKVVLGNHRSSRGRTSSCSDSYNFLRKIAVDHKLKEPIYIKHHRSQYENSKRVDRWTRTGASSYYPRIASCGGWFKGCTWSKKEFDSIFFATIRLALRVEGSTSEDENQIFMLEEKIERIEAKIKNLESLLEDEPDKGLLKLKKEREGDLHSIMTEVSHLRDKVLAGGLSTILDPTKATPEEIHSALRSNVAEKGIVINFAKRSFSVSLQSGIDYKVTLTPGKEVIVDSNDFSLPEGFSFDEPKPKTQTLES